MSEFAVRVVRIADGAVSHHPNADRLSLIQIGGYTAISAKLDDGSHRYRPGDCVVYVPEGAVVPEYLLRRGFWDEKKDRGILAGSNGDRVKALKLRGIFSQGIIFPALTTLVFTLSGLEHDHLIEGPDGDPISVVEGEDVAAALGITKYEPPIPTSMAGEVLHLPQGPVGFDFESIQRVTDLFEDGEPVSVTEKLHGTCFQVGYVPGMANDECFMGGDVYVASKGLGAKSLAFKDNAANDGNVYVRTLRGMMEHPSFEAGLRAVSRMFDGRPIRLFGEVFGGNIQDLGYGLKAPEVRFFDVRAGDEFLPPPLVKFVLENLYLDSVPVLYEGPFDRVVLEGLRDGKDTITGSHMREGIVIRSFTGERHAVHGRKIGKWVSPDYLLRKGATELS